MRIWLLAIGARRSRWEREGFAEYARRLPRSCALELRELGAERRVRSLPVGRGLEREGQRLLGAVPRGARLIALDRRGEQWSSAELAGQLAGWQRAGRDVALLVGGADGLAEAVRARAERLWALSALTLPHGLVRILVAEQIYRAWSQLSGHPYHRG